MHNWSSRIIMVNICKYHGQWWNNWTHLNTSLKLELPETNPLPGHAPDSPCSPSCLPQQMGLHIGVARDKDWDQRVYFEMPGSNDMVKHMHTPISGKNRVRPYYGECILPCHPVSTAMAPDQTNQDLKTRNHELIRNDQSFTKWFIRN